MQRAEKAAREIEAGHTDTERYLAPGMAAIIARHFEDYQKLHEAAAKAVIELSWLDSHRPLPAQTIDIVNALRAALAATAQVGK